MFTGIIEEVGTITKIERGEQSARLTVRAPKTSDGSKLGDSISVSGTCLTIVDIAGEQLSFDAVPETIQRTSLKIVNEGDAVNLERAVAAGDRMGGHFVQGHVDGIAQIESITPVDNAEILQITVASNMMMYVAPKGSVALDGISLTIADVNENGFSVWIIPHTKANTTLQFRKPGDPLNIETDMLAKYVVQAFGNSGNRITQS